MAAYRFPYLLAGGSLVLKQDSKYYEHFYKELKPYVHYVPFKHDLSDLLQQIQWAKDHDEEVCHLYCVSRSTQEHRIDFAACQRSGVSNEPHWLRAATRHGPGTL